MKKILALLVGISMAVTGMAQQQTYSTAADSDPEAKAILNKLKTKYDSYNSIEAAFSLEIQIPEQPVEVQKGTISRQGEKYHMNLSSYTAIGDGEAVFLIMHNNKEVQINDIPDEEDGSILTPESLLKFYENDDYVYIMGNAFMDNKVPVQQIEFKPLDTDSEYSKLRLTVNKKTNDFISVKAFGKDGSRYTFTINTITPNKSFASNHFTFDKAKYQDYYVEDLRE